MIEIKGVRNIILNNINPHDQPSRMHCSHPRSPQNIPDKSDTNISDLTIECFSRDHADISCLKYNF